jgi:hypothetical protein
MLGGIVSSASSFVWYMILLLLALGTLESNSSENESVKGNLITLYCRMKCNAEEIRLSAVRILFFVTHTDSGCTILRRNISKDVE